MSVTYLQHSIYLYRQNQCKQVSGFCYETYFHYGLGRLLCYEPEL